jgi:hypothetical protein
VAADAALRQRGGAAAYALAHAIGAAADVAADLVLMLAVSAAIYLRSRRTAVRQDNVNAEWVGSLAAPEPVAALGTPEASRDSWIDLNALWQIVVFCLLAGAGLPALFALGLPALAMPAHRAQPTALAALAVAPLSASPPPLCASPSCSPRWHGTSTSSPSAGGHRAPQTPGVSSPDG